MSDRYNTSTKARIRVHDNFIFLEDRGVVFGYVPKVACTSWKTVLRRLQGFPDYADKGRAHDRNKSGLHFLTRGEPESEGILNDPKIKKIAFVRNPYTRILSAYLNKVNSLRPAKIGRKENDYFKLIYKDIEQYRASQEGPKSVLSSVKSFFSMSPSGLNSDTANFLVFLQWVKDRKGTWFGDDEHWTPQYEILQFSKVDFDFVGRFENIDNDANTALEMMGADFDFPSKHEVSPHGTDASSKLDRYFTHRHIELVNELYSNDFDAYGYKMKT